jgi:hypothetical protein
MGVGLKQTIKKTVGLDERVIDITRFQIRPKVTEQDLEIHYDDFIYHAEEVGDYFEDRKVFDKVLKDASGERRPKLISRNPNYPFMWVFRKAFMSFDFLRPSERRFHDKYFMSPRCFVSIRRKSGEGVGEREEPLDVKLREDLSEKFKQYPGYEGIIEIPNDRTFSETKFGTFHESLHYLVHRYHAETGRNFVDTFVKKDLSELEKYQAEHLIDEGVVETLTDKLLTHDRDAQFEARWAHYSFSNEKLQGVGLLVGGSMAIATALVLVSSIDIPYLLPLSLVPGRVRDNLMERYKQSKKEEILEPREYPKFKI